jgi:hypothetical protein
MLPELAPEPEPAAPLRLSAALRPAFESLLWRLSDHGLCPRCVHGDAWLLAVAASEDGAEEKAPGLDTVSFFGALPSGVDPAAIRKQGALPPARAHRKRCQVVAIAGLVEALLPPPASPPHTVAEAERPLIVDFCGGSGHLGLVVAARHPECDVLVVDYNAFKLGARAYPSTPPVSPPAQKRSPLKCVGCVRAWVKVSEQHAQLNWGSPTTGRWLPTSRSSRLRGQGGASRWASPCTRVAPRQTSPCACARGAGLASWCRRAVWGK